MAQTASGHYTSYFHFFKLIQNHTFFMKVRMPDLYLNHVWFNYLLETNYSNQLMSKRGQTNDVSWSIQRVAAASPFLFPRPQPSVEAASIMAQMVLCEGTTLLLPKIKQVCQLLPIIGVTRRGCTLKNIPHVQLAVWRLACDISCKKHQQPWSTSWQLYTFFSFCVFEPW